MPNQYITTCALVASSLAMSACLHYVYTVLVPALASGMLAGLVG